MTPSAPSGTRPPFVPWRKIAGLSLLSAPPVVIALLAGLPSAAPAVGFMTGFLAALTGSSRWAMAGVAAALTAHAVTGSMPHKSLYGTALILCIASASAARHGGSRALLYGAFGWVFLAFYGFEPSSGVGPVLLFAAAALWAIPSAHWLGVSGLTAAKPPHAAVTLPVAAVITGGFVATLLLVDLVSLARPYWIPFVFLQVIAASGLDGTRMALRRLLGAVLGVAAVAILLPPDIPRLVAGFLSGCTMILALRLTKAYPVLSRALITAGILLILVPEEPGVANTRLVAEALGVGVLLATAALLSILKAEDRNRPAL